MRNMSKLKGLSLKTMRAAYPRTSRKFPPIIPTMKPHVLCRTPRKAWASSRIAKMARYTALPGTVGK